MHSSFEIVPWRFERQLPALREHWMHLPFFLSFQSDPLSWVYVIRVLHIASTGYPRLVRVNIIRQDVTYNYRVFNGFPCAPVRRLPSRAAVYSSFRHIKEGIRCPSVGECPVPFVFTTCLKISLLFPILSSSSFSLRVCIYEEETDEGGGSIVKGDARSFDSTAFLPIRQTFDSFTWEP